MQPLVKDEYCSEESRIKLGNRNHLKQLSKFRINFSTMSSLKSENKVSSPVDDKEKI